MEDYKNKENDLDYTEIDNNENSDDKNNDKVNLEEGFDEFKEDVNQEEKNSNNENESKNENESDGKSDDEHNDDYVVSNENKTTTTFTNTITATTKTSTIKKVSINNSIIIAGGILGVIIIGILIFSLFLNSSLQGTWCEQKGDITTYYTFNDKGEFIITSGSISMINKYTMDVLENNRITIKDANGSSTADVFYKVEGNSISGKTLTITNEDGEEILNAVSSSLPNIIVKDADFKPYEKIVGEWYNEEGEITFIFNKDGTTKIDFVTQVIEGTYVINDDTLTIKYYTSFDGVIQTAEYTFKCGAKELTLETSTSSVTLTRK